MIEIDKGQLWLEINTKIIIKMAWNWYAKKKLSTNISSCKVHYRKNTYKLLTEMLYGELCGGGPGTS